MYIYRSTPVTYISGNEALSITCLTHKGPVSTLWLMLRHQPRNSCNVLITSGKIQHCSVLCFYFYTGVLMHMYNLQAFTAPGCQDGEWYHYLFTFQAPVWTVTANLAWSPEVGRLLMWKLCTFHIVLFGANMSYHRQPV